MSQFFRINKDNPQGRLLRQAANIIRSGGVIVYPTDSGYAFGCRIGDKDALARIRRLKNLSLEHHFTLVCRDLSELSHYAHFDNRVYRLLRTYTPGPYTFILKGTTEVPRRLKHPRRKTIGLRVPDHTIAQALLEELDEPLMSTTLLLPGESTPMIEPEAMADVLGKHVELIIDGGYCGLEPTTVIDLTEGEPTVIRKGQGDISPFINPI